jgi:hypothetical protein
VDNDACGGVDAVVVLVVVAEVQKKKNEGNQPPIQATRNNANAVRRKETEGTGNVMVTFVAEQQVMLQPVGEI